ncbi:hypothetical protein BIW11_03437 [Tropilaelaps mercedesae]|uniref:Uncharacterized protein n=1 Tax=Tropilaelaps mercedesae TaxID=418985 RepID=A0A1V9XLQ6_9ACAR|nr:hypothetical protein BIW11_03437 [Tropilaelaps mercedesae]
MLINSPRTASVAPSVVKLDVVGTVAFVIGLSCETAADLQKFQYRTEPQNARHWCDIGLWKYSRHPNYFGETLLWWGMFILSCSVLRPSVRPLEMLAILSPLFTTGTILFLSGMPLREHSADQRFGS